MSIGDYAIGVDKNPLPRESASPYYQKFQSRPRKALCVATRSGSVSCESTEAAALQKKRGDSAKKGGKNGAKNDGRNEVRQYE